MSDSGSMKQSVPEGATSVAVGSNVEWGDVSLSDMIAALTRDEWRLLIARGLEGRIEVERYWSSPYNADGDRATADSVESAVHSLYRKMKEGSVARG